MLLENSIVKADFPILDINIKLSTALANHLPVAAMHPLIPFIPFCIPLVLLSNNATPTKITAYP